MRYYILYPGDTEEAVINDINQLGEDNGFKVFWANTGFKILDKAVNQNNPIIEQFKIVTDQGKYISVEKFLDKIKKLKIRIPE
jgi:hypothetical protein|tara:strand:- start:495 stop:743 length:249 start_codon:yes stop_codon:yes gene_type:complete